MYVHLNNSQKLITSEALNTVFQNCNCKLPLKFIPNCDNFRFLSYLLPFLHFQNSEINNRCEYLGGGDDLEVCVLGEGGHLQN